MSKKILVVGGGGREHAIIKALKKSPDCGEIWCAPGNGGIRYDAKCKNIKATDVETMVGFAVEEKFDYVVVAQDDPLALGMVDELAKAGIPAFGPDKAAARIEASKVFSKDLMKKYGIPTAKYETFDDPAKVMAYIKAEGKYPVVIKADGLALGKGVLICENEQQAADGQRSLAALDRSLEELRLRQQLGQVSRQTVDEVEAQRTQVVSQLNTLDTTITTYKSQLQTLIGEEPTGEITLGALPAKGEDGWTAPDYEADLAAAKAASWTLRSAQKALDDAKEDWNDAQSDYRGPRKQYLLQAAEHTWAAAQLTYQSAFQEFETSFRTLYDSLADKENTLNSKRSALAWQQTVLETTQKRYELGQVSKMKLLAAQDDLAAAQSAVDGAWRDLLSARTSYRWAVEQGLM